MQTKSEDGPYVYVFLNPRIDLYKIEKTVPLGPRNPGGGVLYLNLHRDVPTTN